MDEHRQIIRTLKAALYVLAGTAALAGICVGSWSEVWGVVFLLFYSFFLAVTANIYKQRFALLLCIPYVNIVAGMVMFGKLRGGAFNRIHWGVFTAVVLVMWFWSDTLLISVLLTALPLCFIPVLKRFPAEIPDPAPWRISLFTRLLGTALLAAGFFVLPFAVYRTYKVHQFGVTLADFENRPLLPKPHAAEFVGKLPIGELAKIEHFGLNRTWSESDHEPIDIVHRELLGVLTAAEQGDPEQWLGYSRSFQRWFDEDFRNVTLYRAQLRMLEHHIRGISGQGLAAHGFWAGSQERTMAEFNEKRQQVKLAYMISGRDNTILLVRKILIKSILYVPVLASGIDDMKYARSEYYQLRGLMSGRRAEYAEPSTMSVLAEYTIFEKYLYKFSDDLAHLRLARTAAALELYRRQHGDWPRTLQQLVPEYLDAVPLDPYSGRPLRYIPGEAVYSIGHNLNDDGGTGRDRTPSAAHDIVFRLEK